MTKIVYIIVFTKVTLLSNESEVEFDSEKLGLLAGALGLSDFYRNIQMRDYILHDGFDELDSDGCCWRLKA
jgi:hypothetical protein